MAQEDIRHGERYTQFSSMQSRMPTSTSLDDCNEANCGYNRHTGNFTNNSNGLLSLMFMSKSRSQDSATLAAVATILAAFWRHIQTNPCGTRVPSDLSVSSLRFERRNGHPRLSCIYFSTHRAGSELSGPEIEGGRACDCAELMHSAICDRPGKLFTLQCPTMNQLPVETSQELRTQSNNAVPASVKMEKLHDHPEVDHDDSERTRRCSGNQLGFDDISDEPMVKYDGFESVGKPFLPHLDEDEDVVNARSPIICKLSGSRSTTSSPSCVSALKDDEPSWTIQEFQEYLGMLELLQDVSSNSDGEEMCLSAASLGKMERLLTSLLPQGV